MKRNLVFTVLLLSCLSFAPSEKLLKVEASLDTWNKHYIKLETIKKILDESNLPNQQVKYAVKSIDSLEMLIVAQLQKQMADTSKKK